MRGATACARTQHLKLKFQSTLLMRGATYSCASLPTTLKFQSTLLMRGATRCRPAADPDAGISIHAPHARSDQPYCQQRFYSFKFQSTLLMRGATLRSMAVPMQHKISIHAPHARSDDSLLPSALASSHISIHAPHARSDARSPANHFSAIHFNPRSSCEERLCQF